MARMTTLLPPKPPTTPYQTPQWVTLNRADHVWIHKGTYYQCGLCGAITEAPPHYPTPADWMPTRIEALTADERKQVPPQASKKGL